MHIFVMVESCLWQKMKQKEQNKEKLYKCNKTTWDYFRSTRVAGNFSSNNYNHRTGNLAIYSHVTSQDKLPETKIVYYCHPGAWQTTWKVVHVYMLVLWINERGWEFV